MRGRPYHLRAALMPYLYTAAWRASQTGVLLMHPLYYEHPAEEEAYTASAFDFDSDRRKNPLAVATPLQYLFGPSFMAAPAQAPATRTARSGTEAAVAAAADDNVGTAFTLYPGDWCGQGVCMHRAPIGGIQSSASAAACQAGCAADSKCLSFDFQSGT